MSRKKQCSQINLQKVHQIEQPETYMNELQNSMDQIKSVMQKKKKEKQLPDPEAAE